MSAKYKPKFTYLEPTFICTACKKTRPHAYRETGRNRCVICSNYRRHVARFNKLTYSEFESNYIRNKEIGRGIKNKCNMCLEVKDPSLFKNSYRGVCKLCWYADEQLIVRRTRKIIRVPIANSRRGVSLFNRTFNYAFDVFKAHIESLFTHGMTWEAVVNKEIHIDHIIPASAFDHSKPYHFEVCWSLSNLQPLWAPDNQAKHDKLINGQRVQDIKKGKDYRAVLNKLILDLYGIDLM